MPPPSSAPVAERRICSVLFCDLVGFTPLSESRDPEEVRELLSQYFDIARTIIGRYGGVVEKFIGDAVMAVWGTPVAGEGDAERCVRAAMDIVAAVEDLGHRASAEGLAARAGVVTGEVAVTIGARSEGMVAGDAVNTASRVQSAAAAGTVWVDDATHRLAAAGIGFAPAGEHTLKGKASPMALWSATRVLSGVGGSQRVDGLEAPMAGRDAELRTVKELLHASIERRAPRLVLLVGPAGVGKSRLGWEFEKYTDGLVDAVYWHRGRCLSYGDGVVFWALAEIVRQRLGIAEDDSRELAASKLVEGLNAYVPDPAEREYVGPRLARLLGVPFGGDTDAVLPREELFAGWRVFFERLAAVQPVVLLIENGQHADGGLLDFLDHLVDWAREVPIYVLVFTRPELLDIRPGFGTGRNRSTLRIDPLDATAMGEVVDALVPGMPADARATITGRAQGIPLFAVETVRSLVDRDIVVPHEGVYRLVGDIGELSVPDSLHGLLSARLDALDTELRALVATAAVIGGNFPATAVVAVSTQPEQQVLDGLEELLRREVLSISADPLSPQVGEYRFSQDLLRQVAYETLSRRDRKALHLAVAEHLRRVFPGDGDEMSDAVAHHYLDAMDAVPDATDVADIRAQAIAMLTRGGDRARRSGSAGAAATAYARAADLTSVPDDEAALEGAADLYERASRAAQTGGGLHHVGGVRRPGSSLVPATGSSSGRGPRQSRCRRCAAARGPVHRGRRPADPGSRGAESRTGRRHSPGTRVARRNGGPRGRSGRRSAVGRGARARTGARGEPE